MTETTTEPTEPKRKMMALPLPTHKLVSRIAALRGQSISDALYTVFREELRRRQDGTPWALCPAPFSIKPTYLETGCGVLVWHPQIESLILNRREATDLAEAIAAAAVGTNPRFKLKTEVNGRNVRVILGGRYVGLSVDGESATMTFPTAIDVADALKSASVHAGPIPAVETH